MVEHRKTALFFVLISSALYIVLTLALFASPTRPLFNKDGDLENWAGVIIGSGIAVYIAISMFIYSNFEQKRISVLIQKRRQFAMQQIGKNLLGQASFFAGLQKRSGENNKGINVVTGQKINYEDFAEKALQFNNAEINLLLVSSSDVLDSKLTQDLIEIVGKIRFLSEFKEMIEERGEWMYLTMIRKTIEKYFPDILGEFDKLGGSLIETHNFDKSHKS